MISKETKFDAYESMMNKAPDGFIPHTGIRLVIGVTDEGRSTFMWECDGLNKPNWLEVIGALELTQHALRDIANGRLK